MKTEQEIKDKVTPDIIKKMCEIAKGFTYYDSGCRFEFDRKVYNTDNVLAFSTLIHRAVEGWNKKQENKIIYIEIDNRTVWKKYGNCCTKKYQFIEHQPENLTACECALLHCLLEIFEEKI